MPHPAQGPRETGRSHQADWARALREAAPYLGIGGTFAVSVAGGTVVGWWLDQKLGTLPWLTLLGALVGLSLGFYSFIRTVTEKRP